MLVAVNHTTSEKTRSIDGLGAVDALTPYVLDNTTSMTARPNIAVSGGEASVTLPAKSVVILSGDKPAVSAVAAPVVHRVSAGEHSRTYSLSGRLLTAREHRLRSGLNGVAVMRYRGREHVVLLSN